MEAEILEILLKFERAEAAAEQLDRSFHSEIRALEAAVQRIAKGESGAAREYIGHWRRLANGVLALIHRDRPDLIVQGPAGQFLIVDIKGDPAEVTTERLLAAAVMAPFSGWVAQVGLGRGIALRLLAEIRESVPGAIPLLPQTGLSIHWASGESMITALRLIERAVADEARTDEPRLRTAGLLKRVMELFDLDRTDLAKLFGVKRQAVEQWELRGVPAERQAKLATMLAIGELLHRKLRSSVFPGVARRPATAYHGRTMLQMIEDDKQDEVLEGVRKSFDWATTA